MARNAVQQPKRRRFPWENCRRAPGWLWLAAGKQACEPTNERTRVIAVIEKNLSDQCRNRGRKKTKRGRRKEARGRDGRGRTETYTPDFTSLGGQRFGPLFDKEENVCRKIGGEELKVTSRDACVRNIVEKVSRLFNLFGGGNKLNFWGKK